MGAVTQSAESEWVLSHRVLSSALSGNHEPFKNMTKDTKDIISDPYLCPNLESCKIIRIHICVLTWDPAK